MTDVDVAFLTDEEREQLAGTLGVDERELGEALVPFAHAGVEELVRMVLGQKVYTRGSDIREYRLLLLIKHVFDGRIPGEAEVSRLFGSTESGSRSLIRSVMSKYQYELSAEIAVSLRELLAGANQEEDGDPYEIVVHSSNLVDELDRRIQSIDGTLPSVKKKRGTASTYKIMPSAYERLTEALAAEDQAGA